MAKLEVQFRQVDEHRYEAFAEDVTLAIAHVNGSYIDRLFVSKAYRRQGIALGLVNFIIDSHPDKLHRCPVSLKTKPVIELSRKLGDRLLEEFKE